MKSRYIVCLLTFTLQLHAQASMSQFLASQQLIESGKAVFQQNCMGCHGVDAKGQGPAAFMLDPKPRNLVEGSFKFRSTPMGSNPTTQDLIRTIDQGIPGSSMPGFPLLSSNQKYALVAFIKSLRPDWEKNESSTLAIPQTPQALFNNRTLFLASAFRGQMLYLEACISCHGDKGLGDGPSAEGLVDNDNNPLKPANLSLPRIKSGRRAQDVYKAILTGLDGTPMPTFDGIYEESQLWDLVAYVFFLRGQAANLYEKDFVLDDSLVKAEKNFNKPSASIQQKGNGDESWE